MMHKNRIHHVGQVDSATTLADKLTAHTWCLCTGFSVAGRPDYLFLSDATSEDGAGEYAVIKKTKDGFIQVESITFSWCQPAQALAYIQQALASEFDSQGWPVTINLDESPKHRCHFCE